ncbi:MAG: demethylmenaquinone methyltransferase / 2-methoxy-6-polyprenyl,4-benzoquinol methylase [Blastocatellia bacterium]|nr:demethylmenaquinone methyltransferase / 2-methoxy-6-polyprenyl,4-benzoquinol methylase [Blastocatellia bacterium]
MFARIAGRYDFLNHLLSANTDKRWRRTVATKLSRALARESIVLDVACGTGDLSIQIFETIGGRVVGLDFCRPMLEIARQKTDQIPFVEGDALELPFADETFDAVTIAFGLRNLTDTAQGLNELRRVTKAGGWLAILEFSKPTSPGFRRFYEFYFRRLLPRLGGLVSGSQSAYQYLPDSVLLFPDQAGLAGLMRDAGFGAVEWQNLTAGVAAIHMGQRAAAPVVGDKD